MVGIMLGVIEDRMLRLLEGQGVPNNHFKSKAQSIIRIKFNREENELNRFEKTYIEIAENSGLDYKVQDIFHYVG